MGNITFMVGNGFDVNLGLKTRYTDYYGIYTKIKPDDSKVVKQFKTEILKDTLDWKDWKDFEFGMGDKSKDFVGASQAEDFIECVDDFVVGYIDYLKSECAKVDWGAVSDSIYRAFEQSIRFFYQHIRSVNQSNVKSLTFLNDSQTTINFLQLNYTNVLDALIDRSNLARTINTLLRQGNREINRFGKNLHIHGRMDGGYPAIGVNDVSQLTNPILRKSPEVKRAFVKPDFLTSLENRDVNQKIDRSQAVEITRLSNVICSFGCSIGDTDKFWWELIGESLIQSNRLLIIFDICGSIDDGISRRAILDNDNAVSERKNELIERFVRLSGLAPEWPTANPDRIIIELDTDMFKFKLPLINDVCESRNDN